MCIEKQKKTSDPFYFLLLLALAVLTPSIGLAAKDSGGKDGTHARPHAQGAPGNGSHSAPASDKIESATIPKGETFEGKVIGVIDGDDFTLLVDKTQYVIRLQGIDAPEKDQPFCDQATKALSKKVLNKTVKVLSQGKDIYGRTLGIVSGKDCVNTAMVREGWAWHYKHFTESKVLAEAEEEARAAKKGLWADAHPVAPWDWRYQKKQKEQEEEEQTDDPFSSEAPGQSPF